MAVDDIPRAAARTGDAAVVGGGGVPAPSGETPVYDVWMITDDGEAVELPPLQADGYVEGLSGVEVDDTLVLAAMDCTYGMGQTSGYLGCGTPRTPVLWVKDSAATRWSRHVFPDDVLTAVWPDELEGGASVMTNLKVVGARDDAVVVAFTSRDRTRFIAFDPAHGRFDVLADAPPLGGSHNSTPFCVTDNGEVLHLRLHRSLPEQSATGPVTDAVSVARLEPDGSWSHGTPLDVSVVDGVGVDLACPSDRDPIMAMSAFEGEPILATIDDESLTISPDDDINHALERLVDQPALQGRAGISAIGVDAYGDLVIQAPNGLLDPPVGHGRFALYTVDSDSELAAVDGFENVAEDSTTFVAGHLIGTIRFDDGHIRVRHIA